MRDPGRRRNGLTIIETFVIMVLSFVVLALLLPMFARSPRLRTLSGCLDNLRQLGTDFRLWADDNNNHYPMHFVGANNYPQLTPARSLTGQPLDYAEAYKYFKAMSNEIGSLNDLVCPADSRIAQTNYSFLQNSNVSYFAGQDADASNPKMLLAGDRNLMIDSALAETGILSIYPTNTVTWSRRIHNESGNVTFADGSAQKLSSRQLQTAIQNTGTNVNRLVFP